MKEGVESLKRAGADVVWIPGGCCDPEIHKRLDLERDLDIGFVGTDGGVPRKFYLQELRERYPNSYIGHADYREISDIYSRSKIGFSYAIRRETLTMRSLEIMACGALCLANPPKDDTLEVLDLQDHQHLVLYHSPRELFQLIDYYLAHPQERTVIAEQGYKAAVGRHTYRHQLAQMLEVLASRRFTKVLC
jgi:spore maturation protein CgeB